MQPVPTGPATLPEEIADSDLVARVRAGETALYAVLVRRHNQRLYRIVRAIVRDDAEAEDIVQQAHVTGYRQLAQLAGGASYPGWLTRIAVNEAFGRMRRSKRHGLVSLDDAGGEATMTDSTTPEHEAYRGELARLLERQIDQLPDALRVVFVMRDVEELNTTETAALLGVSEAAVRVRLHRARQSLQGTLSEVMTSAPDAFHFAGERCQRITHAVLRALGITES